MKVNVKHVVEIAGGVFAGVLAHEMLNKAGKLVAKGIGKIQKKGSKEAQALPFIFFRMRNSSYYGKNYIGSELKWTK